MEVVITEMELTQKARLFPISGSPPIAFACCCLLSGVWPCADAAEFPHESAFKNPPLAMKSVPLWHMNGNLTKEEITAQLRDSRDRSGFAGVAVLPVTATKPEYLSEEYFVRYGDILETCKDLGMKVAFYDDINFPSGSAGGQMAKHFPNDIACRLDKTETDLAGPKAWNQAMPEGIFMGAVAVNLQTWERHDISANLKDGHLYWQVPSGNWKIMTFSCVRAGKLVDYLNPESIDRFFSLTYDEYYKRFRQHFGSTIFMTFFDDIGLRGGERRTWTPGFNAKFQAKYGISPVQYYPSLWHDIGPDTEAARIALLDFRAELLAEGYPRKVQEWASKHGIQSSGHAMGQYHPQPTFLGGDHILFYRHSDIPMIDSIHYYGHGRPGFKLTSSAACSFDRPLTAVEIYGNYKKFDSQMLYRSGMELFARGANLFLPHGMWYDPAKVRIKPLISHFNAEVATELPEYNKWVARGSLLLQGGRPVADIAVLYPVASMQAFARLDAVVDQPTVKGNTHPGLFQPPGSDLNQISDLLTGSVRRDFTFLHPEILDDRCEVKGPVLHLNNPVSHQDYRVFIMPGGRVIHWSNLQKILQFYQSGGKVIATTLLPDKSAEFGHDKDIQEAIQKLFGPAPKEGALFSKRTNAAGGVAYFLPIPDASSLASALNDAMPDPDVGFSNVESGIHPEKGMLSYLHKIKDGRNIYFFANSTDVRVDTEITLRGDLKLECWNPHHGETSPLKTSALQGSGRSSTRIHLQLEPVKSVFFVEAAKP